MTSTSVGVQEQLQALQLVYAGQLPEKLARLEETWDAVLGEAEAGDALVTLHRLAHNLAGSAATYGYTLLGSVARALEIAVQELIAAGGVLAPESQAHIATLLDSLHHISRAPDRRLPGDILYRAAAHTAAPEAHNRLVFLAEDDPELAADLATQIGYFGYNVQVFARPDALMAAAQQTPPIALVMAIMFPHGQLAGVEAVAAAQRAGLTPPPTIFISARYDMQARLQAVRAGGAAYFTKPLDIPALIDKLDQLTAPVAQEPYRILIVDDEPSLAWYHAVILEQAGMIPFVATDPLQVTSQLAELKPDLILMDMYMPGCTGLELAAVIRQEEAYVSIPIVFLSSETSMDKQLAAMQLGGDDFLTKPIQPDHLISAVTSRVARLRILRSFMVRDSLTGLLKHTVIKDYLGQEVARSQRQSAPFTFAMLDIDHFKAVNDTHGHPTGDQVIKSLSRLLQQRLRRSDHIGRYGGEEFAVILPNTSGADAWRVLDELRAGFAQVRHQSEQGAFYTTFSCGLAGFPAFADATQITNGADKALYAAKQAGRNRVVLTGSDD